MNVHLNHDVVKLLLTKYIHPGDLVSFIQVCKRFYKAVPLENIYLKYIAYITQKANPFNKRDFNDHTICDLCNALGKNL